MDSKHQLHSIIHKSSLRELCDGNSLCVDEAAKLSVLRETRSVFMCDGVMDTGGKLLVTFALSTSTFHGHLYNRFLLRSKQLHDLKMSTAVIQQSRLA